MPFMQIIRGTVVLMRHLAAPQDFYSLLVHVSVDDLADAVFDGVGLADFKSRANAFLLA